VRHLTVNEAAAALQLSVPTIKRYLYEGKLRSTKLPGGQHRIPESEIDRLLSPDTAATPHHAADEASVDDRVTVLEKWMTELQADTERLQATVEVISRFCARAQPPKSEADMEPTERAGHRILVLGPGCRRCDALHELAQRVIESLDREDVSLERVTHLDDIAAFGPILTPTLTVDDRIVVSGRVPSESALRKMLERCLA
jgi:small redox-active disulfide protein 2